MKIKQKPEDFSVKESFRFDEVPTGHWRVYLMDKQKLSTFDAIARIQERFGLKPGSISYCGLKDKQGRTEQLIAVDSHDVDIQDPDLRLKFLGRTDKALSARNTTSNRFAVTVRQVRTGELHEVTLAAAEVNRLGVVNYFDSQRFGSLKHGQGFIAKDLIRGDFEAALHNYLAVPSELDRSEDAKVKAFWRDNWGDWEARCPFDANKKYVRILKSLRAKPGDWVNAFLQIDADYRALLLFTYQSYLWNECARRLLQMVLPREQIFPMGYQAGTLLHHKDAAPAVLDYLRTATVPLLAPNSSFKDPKVGEAVKWVLGREKITLEALRIEAAPKLLYFKHEERPFLVTPHKLVVGKPRDDEFNRGYKKVNIAFTLPPGSYATLVVKRLFHFGLEKQQDEEELEPAAPREPRKRFDHKSGRPVDRRHLERVAQDRKAFEPEESDPSERKPQDRRPQRPEAQRLERPVDRRPKRTATERKEQGPTGAAAPAPAPAAVPPAAAPRGFLAQQRERKLRRQANRTAK